MESKASEVAKKRMKLALEEKEAKKGDVSEIIDQEQSETIVVGSDEMELNISRILEKIERFTQLVSELLESGTTAFKDLSNEFEERLIMIHKEHIEKWQEEIKELRELDASNEVANGLLYNAQNLLHNVHVDS